MSEQMVVCPDCQTEMPDSADFCPGCGRPRTRVHQRCVELADQTGIPYETLIERARNGEPLEGIGSDDAVEVVTDGTGIEPTIADLISEADRVRFLAEGYRAELEVAPHEVVIRRKGMRSVMTHGLKGDKHIRIDHIAAVQFKRPGVTNGYIQFVFPGSGESKEGIFAALSDENTILFRQKHLQRFEMAMFLIEEHREQARQGSRGDPQKTMPESVSTSASDPIEALRQLASLRDAGIVSEEEFETKKRELLSRL